MTRCHQCGRQVAKHPVTVGAHTYGPTCARRLTPRRPQAIDLPPIPVLPGQLPLFDEETSRG